MRSLMGPRALAILSCALALLAAQPVAAGRMAAPVTAGIVAGVVGEAGVATRGVKREERAAERWEAAGILSSARRLHVLATFEILHRLLSAELRPVERGAECCWTSCFLYPPETVERVGVEAGRVLGRVRRGDAAGVIVLAQEARLYVTTHLPPPVA